MKKELKEIRRKLSAELRHLRATNNSTALNITNIVVDIDDIITAQNIIHNSDACVKAIMDNISDRRGYDLYSCDEDIIDDIKQSLETILRTHFT